MSGKFLIVTADDFGLHEAVNEAVKVASMSGILTAASLMVAAPEAAAAVKLAQTLPNLRVGLHLVLSDGKPLLNSRSVPALVSPSGRFRDATVSNSIRFATLPTVRAQLAAEIRAQFEAFARTGLQLDHVNAHKHFHVHPSILELILRIGGEFGMSAVRIPHEPLGYSARVGNAANAALLLPWVALMRKRLRTAGMTVNDQVFGIADSGRLDTQSLLCVLGQLPAGVTEIYLHPAIPTSAPLTQSMGTYRHGDELEALLHPAVRAAVVASGARSGGYRDLPRFSL